MLSSPGLRVFTNKRFRELVAGLLLALGILGAVTFLIGRASMPMVEGQFGIDFAAYFAAALRLVETGSPYAPTTLGSEAPVGVYGAFLYPPPLAQVLVPLTPLSLPTATLVWLGFQLTCLALGVAIAVRASGMRVDVETGLWLAVGCTWYLPILDTLWKGNVSGVQLLLVALLFAGIAAGALATATNVMLKLAPLVLLPLIVVRSRRSALVFLGGFVLILVPSVLAAPEAWEDFVGLFSDLVGGAVDYAPNMAPDALVVSAFGFGPVVAQVVRWVSLLVGVGAVAASVALARRPGGWTAAAIMGTAALLLLPAVLWYHYLVLLLPLAIVAWRRATVSLRAAVVGGGAMVTVGVAWLPLAFAGATLMVIASLRAVWPAGGRNGAA